jgi:rhodanese-related sulfurtransferase
MRKEIALTLLASLCLLLSACGNGTTSSESDQSGVQITTASENVSYQQITQEKAKEMMQADDGHIIVDVRRQDEYDSGHIPDAILIPNESIDKEQPKELPDLDQIILIYCRSGRRSKEASQKLADMGYTNIYEFGGIIDWTGEVVTSE